MPVALTSKHGSLRTVLLRTRPRAFCLHIPRLLCASSSALSLAQAKVRLPPISPSSVHTGLARHKVAVPLLVYAQIIRFPLLAKGCHKVSFPARGAIRRGTKKISKICIRYTFRPPPPRADYSLNKNKELSRSVIKKEGGLSLPEKMTKSKDLSRPVGGGELNEGYRQFAKKGDLFIS